MPVKTGFSAIGVHLASGQAGGASWGTGRARLAARSAGEDHDRTARPRRTNEWRVRGSSRKFLRRCNGRACFFFRAVVRVGRRVAEACQARAYPSYLAFVERGRYFKSSDPNGAVAQLGERRVRNAEVEGSIPFRSIGLLEKRGRSQARRRPALATSRRSVPALKNRRPARSPPVRNCLSPRQLRLVR